MTMIEVTDGEAKLIRKLRERGLSEVALDSLVGLGSGECEACEGCRTVCKIEDMRLTHDSCWLCHGCWDSIVDEMNRGEPNKEISSNLLSDGLDG